jgi:hypothetical protein
LTRSLARLITNIADSSAESLYYGVFAQKFTIFFCAESSLFQKREKGLTGHILWPALWALAEPESPSSILLSW